MGNNAGYIFIFIIYFQIPSTNIYTHAVLELNTVKQGNVYQRRQGTNNLYLYGLHILSSYFPYIVFTYCQAIFHIWSSHTIKLFSIYGLHILSSHFPHMVFTYYQAIFHIWSSHTIKLSSIHDLHILSSYFPYMVFTYYQAIFHTWSSHTIKLFSIYGLHILSGYFPHMVFTYYQAIFHIWSSHNIKPLKQGCASVGCGMVSRLRTITTTILYLTLL